MKPTQHLPIQRALVLIALIGLVALVIPSAGATPHPGQSVKVAIIGSPSVISGGSLPTSGPAGELGDFTFTDLAPGSVNTASLTPFDTVVLNVASPEMNCDTATLPATAKADLVSFVGGGKKMVIYDSECAPGTGVDYTWLPFPFTTNNPGQAGAHGTLTIVEQNLLSTSDPADPHFIDAAFLGSSTDAVGDANVLVTNDPNWCVDMSATNTNQVTGATHTYANYPAGSDTGLFIYNGLDVDYMGLESSPDGLRKIWVQELQHPFNPSNLPCRITVLGITLSPTSASNVVGSDHTVTATVTDLLGKPEAGVAVTFEVHMGPNTGVTGTATTDAKGEASFTYTGSGGVGTDTIKASFVDGSGNTRTSQNVTKEWTAQPSRGCTITGTPQDDVLHGTAKDDVICGLGGDDLLLGKQGDDRLLGGSGNDRLLGGTGKDRLEGGSGNDRLEGLSGDDRLLGGTGDDQLEGGSGKDRLEGQSGDDRLEGGTGDDELLGGSGDDRLLGGSGNDRLQGGSGDDRLEGQSGDDQLLGGTDSDHCNGGPATDTATGCEAVVGVP